ncbi:MULTISPECIES: bifunctional 2-polyprenyl-6-hydroxyphenol methylase/3-demethylubiquinol 3-O-methyltransferase UbiG [unclassified Minwuia]|jgi:2-polyprenyl-6-hydroxyphenyl methylase / 3-demethylubiquinone-9 3-methyltransferase|uniref:bifunctional 2-polyprenyl-6-hydroxyphenol methylase/3-demethylubiquinol 3-O-methyltransferase UbiG n=1 Tax=unclassified Minwuia TaxID=2618799 RepID=UPI0024797E23|nr:MULTISPECIES: bifunctional 2-polyprenyl-6-hydroxyphenol methylase/3-demethylubiquinol 3-O-methyltransferase UbiG [unclassified Minwuia]
MTATTVDPEEISRFSAMAETWWDADGPMKPLHQLTPARMRYLKAQIVRHFDCNGQGPAPLKGLSILDIGCGGGLVAEPMARLGGDVTGVDAAGDNIQAARTHATGLGLQIDYRHDTAEALVEQGAQFDVVLALEIVEHVADVGLFVASVAKLVRPGGLVIFSTLNRTPKAWALAVFGAERVMRWLPVGTHSHAKFVKPSELAAHFRNGGLQLEDLTGLVFSPLTGWSLDSRDLDVNYFATATRGSD